MRFHPGLEIGKGLRFGNVIARLGLVVETGFVIVETRLQVEDGPTVLDGDHPSGGETAAIPDAVNLVEDRRFRITRAKEVGVQGVHHATRLLDRAG